jgi:transposase
MIGMNRRTHFYICKSAIDMRASYDSLYLKVKEVLKKEPISGHVFVFMNKKRNSIKALYYDGTGLVILSKRIEKGLLFMKINPFYQQEIVLTQAEFNLFFEGASLEKRFVESPSLPARG